MYNRLLAFDPHVISIEAGLDDPAYGPYPRFPNRLGRKMTRQGITYVVKKYVQQARKTDPAGIPAVVSPHVLRRLKAMYLLQSDVNLVYIHGLRGHLSIATTEVYARADRCPRRAGSAEARPADKVAVRSVRHPGHYAAPGDILPAQF